MASHHPGRFERAGQRKYQKKKLTEACHNPRRVHFINMVRDMSSLPAFLL